MLSFNRLENSVITAYRANSALTKVHAVKQRGEKVRHKFPPPRELHYKKWEVALADREPVSRWFENHLGKI